MGQFRGTALYRRSADRSQLQPGLQAAIVIWADSGRGRIAAARRSTLVRVVHARVEPRLQQQESGGEIRDLWSRPRQGIQRLRRDEAWTRFSIAAAGTNPRLSSASQA